MLTESCFPSTKTTLEEFYHLIGLYQTVLLKKVSDRGTLFDVVKESVADGSTLHILRLVEGTSNCGAKGRRVQAFDSSPSD